MREPRPIEFSHSRGASALATRPEGPERYLRPVSMASVEMVVPDQVVGNDVIAEAAGVTEQWIVHRTGVHERRWAADGDSVATIATAAGR
ncbi:MAG TPA: hypothetical protein VHJ37_01595, partial [Thermoleophilaceae bacterium]|nr:hypothetical protein [Thermoleophilaceae bacterium]